MSAEACQRCGERPPGFEGRVPFASPLREEVPERICRECWNEWLQMQIKLINELALNLGDPRSHAILEAHARDFLRFSEGAGGTDFEAIGATPPEEPTKES